MNDVAITNLVFYVNGRKVVDPNPDPEETLLQYLRAKLRLSGTKLGCGEGGCGACTVMLSKYDPRIGKVRHFSVNACLAPVCSVHGMAVTTVEGIGSIKNGLHPIQEKLANSHGSQCGFCTPGIVMSMYALVRNNPHPSMEEMQVAFEGNLCRCTGYRPILEGLKPFTQGLCAMGENCCRNKTPVSNGTLENGHGDNECNIQNGYGENDIHKQNGYLPIDSSQDPIFPPGLLKCRFDKEKLLFRGERVTWIQPSSLEQLLELLSEHPNAKCVAGSTEVGIEMKSSLYPVLISIVNVPELKEIHTEKDGIKIGASVTLSQLEDTLKQMVVDLPDHQTRSYKAILEMLKWFAGQQIRNVASVGGNIVTASPISDLNPMFIAAGVTLEVQSKEGGKRCVKLDGNFFTGYRKTILQKSEILVSLKIPFTSKNEYIFGYKQAHRREDDISIVNAGLRVEFEIDTSVVKNITMAFGGMAPTTAVPSTTMKKCIGREWNEQLLNDVTQMLAEDLPLSPSAPGGMTNYRRTLTVSFFFKFYLTVNVQLSKKIKSIESIPKSHRSATDIFHKDDITACQKFEEVIEGQEEHDAVGRPLTHLSALKQVAGEAVYVDDIPQFADEYYLAFVYSSKAHAKLLSVDASTSLRMPGVVAYINENDVPGSNVWGPIIPNELTFQVDKVTCVGQIIGAVVADTKAHAKQAARSVRVEYEELPPIVTIEEAIAAESYFCHDKISFGDIQKGFELSDHVLEGEVKIGGQDHFYLETQASLAVPKNEDGEIEMFVATQNPTETQMCVASALGIAYNKVTVRVKRLGGGFGGKEHRCNLFTLPIAIAAQKLGKPVRCMLDRDEDMVSSGGRHPVLGKYKIGFTSEGKIQALELDIYVNAGNTLDLSECVMKKCLCACANSYLIPHLLARGHVCKTNISSNTAFRGFGAPQAMFVCENYVADIALFLNKSPAKVRELNLMKEGEITHYNQALTGCNMQRCWDECMENSNFIERSNKVEQFNRKNRWKKRGITIIPTTFGIAFELPFLNQAGALVMIYRDGSVLLTHGGVEMGQGLHTKMIQVASRALKVPVSKIHISETSTNTVPNTTSTAASTASDLNGMAVLNACTVLRKRLEPYITENPKGTWEDWVNAAYFDRVSLSSTGFYKTPDLCFNMETNTGRLFNYYSFGVGCSEVEVDCLTGDHQIIRTDIVQDVGQSLNPAIDIGQIEGAFMQGYGLLMLEQQKMSPEGHLRSRGPGTYKIPAFGDIPAKFNVSLLKGSHNKRAVYSSKGIGEPPLFLSASVFFAVKQAIMDARKEEGHEAKFRLDAPATPERIRMACKDRFTEQFPEPTPKSFKPWFVDM